jgi:hypothetical protein
MHCQRDTLIKYLLDELYTYEGDHCDALNPFDSLDSVPVARQTGEQGEVNPMCSLELRSRLEELHVQNEKYQRRMEERYQINLEQQQVQLAHHVNNLLQGIHLPRPSHSPHIPTQSAHRYHPYPQALIGPGVVCFFLMKLSPSIQLTWSNLVSS